MPALAKLSWWMLKGWLCCFRTLLLRETRIQLQSSRINSLHPLQQALSAPPAALRCSSVWLNAAGSPEIHSGAVLNTPRVTAPGRWSDKLLLSGGTRESSAADASVTSGVTTHLVCKVQIPGIVTFQSEGDSATGSHEARESGTTSARAVYRPHILSLRKRSSSASRRSGNGSSVSQPPDGSGLRPEYRPIASELFTPRVGRCVNGQHEES